MRSTKKTAQKRPTDVNQLAHFLGELSTTDNVAEPDAAEVSRVMAALGRKGGKKGGKRRLETMTQEQRSVIAFRAAQARWAKSKKP